MFARKHMLYPLDRKLGCPSDPQYPTGTRCLRKPRRFLPGPSIAPENDDEFPSLSVYPDPPDVFPGDDVPMLRISPWLCAPRPPGSAAVRAGHAAYIS